MPSKPPTFRSPAQKAATVESHRMYEQRRHDTQPWRAWYKLPVWQNLRRHQLQLEPLCELCRQEQGLLVPATVVHHKHPHQGDWSLFVDAGNLQSVCKPHHDRDLQVDEAARRGRR